MTQVYAGHGDLAGFLSLTDFQALTQEQTRIPLQVASNLVRQATRNDYYCTDAAGYPEDPEQRLAFRRATAAQVAYWSMVADLATVHLGAAGIPDQLSSASVMGATVQFDRSGTAAVAASFDALFPEARTFLTDEGLCSQTVGRVVG